MKAGWELKTLEQIATTFGRGKSKHRPRNDANLYGGEYPFIQTGDVRNADHFISEYSQTYSEAGLAQSKLWPKGTICITIAANIAETGILGFDACFPDSVIGVVPNPVEAEVGYVEYLLQSFKVRIQALGQGSAQANINMGTFEGERFPFPCVAEQKRIVTLLDEAFDGIATARAHAEKNLQNARAVFESHLQSVFTQSGDGWTKTTLGKATGGVFTGPFGSLLHKSDYVENGIPLVNPAHITDIGVEPDLRKTVSEATARKLSSYIMSKGDIVIGRRGEMGRCALVTDIEDGWLCGTGSFYIKPSLHCDSGYLVRFLRSDACKRRLEKIAGGAVMPNLSNSDLSNLSFYLPSLEIQKAISDAIDDIATETQRLESLYQRKLATLEELKKSLLAKAFSGAL